MKIVYYLILFLSININLYSDDYSKYNSPWSWSIPPDDVYVKPIIKSKPDIKYTRTALRLNIEGVVEVFGDVGLDGKLTNVKITSTNKILEQMVIDYLPKMIFNVGTRNGKPIVMKTSYKFIFVLKD